MTRALDVIEELLDWRGYHHLRLDGATAAAERGGLVQKFNEPGGLSVLVPSCNCSSCRDLHPIVTMMQIIAECNRLTLVTGSHVQVRTRLRSFSH